MRPSPFLHDGLRLSVATSASGADLVFQHGLCGDSAQTMDVNPALDGFCFQTLECRGHGGSDAGPLSDLSLDVFADDLIAFIGQRCAPPVVLGGISMGAALAAMVAVRRPDLVRALVFARPAWFTLSAPANLAPYAEVGDLLARLPPHQARAEFERSPTVRRLEIEAPDNLASLRGFFTREPIEATTALLTRIAHDGPGLTLADYAAVRAPTLVLGHGRDFAHPLDLARRLAAALPNARIEEITAKADDPARYRADFRAALARFLGKLRA